MKLFIWSHMEEFSYAVVADSEDAARAAVQKEIDHRTTDRPKLLATSLDDRLFTLEIYDVGEVALV